LTIGAIARVTEGDPNNVRQEPHRNSRLIGQLLGGQPFIVLAGPVCQHGLAWWLVRDDRLEGWTAEGENGVYWLQPALIHFPVIASPMPTLRMLGQFTLDSPISALTATVESIYVGTATHVEQWWISDPFAFNDPVTWNLGHRMGPVSQTPTALYPIVFNEVLVSALSADALHLERVNLDGVSDTEGLSAYGRVYDVNQTRTQLIAAERGDARIAHRVDLTAENYGASLARYQLDAPLVDAKLGGAGEVIALLTETTLRIDGTEGTSFQMALPTQAAALVLRPDMRQALILAADQTRLDLIALDGGTSLTITDPDGIAHPIYSPDGLMVVYASREVKLFDALSGLQLTGLPRRAQFLDMSDGGQLIVIGYEATVEVWGVWR
jgi:hypothetical protein